MVERWLSFVERLLQLIAAFRLGEQQGQKKAEDATKRAIELEVELEKERHRKALEEANRVLNDRDIVRRAIKRGRRLLGMPD